MTDRKVVGRTSAAEARVWRISLVVRTLPSQGGIAGSNPACATLTLSQEAAMGFLVRAEKLRIAAYERIRTGERTGQAYYNALYFMDADLAKEIEGTDDDPFHDDSKLADFLKHVYHAWDSEVAQNSE